MNTHDNITNCQQGLAWLFRAYPGLDKSPRTAPAASVPSVDPGDADAYSLDDEILIDKILKSKQGPKFDKLHFQGDYSDYLHEDGTPDHSRGDAAEIAILAFWTKDDEQIRRIFSASALAQREKGQNRRDYQDLTISRAIAKAREWGFQYDPENYGRLQWPETEVTGRGKSTPRKKSRLNVEYLLARLGVTVRFNKVSKKPEFTGLEKLTGGNDRLTFDAAIAALADAADRCGLKTGKTDFVDLIGLIAELNAYSPVCEYLQRCRLEWDGQQIYIDRLFSCLHLSRTPAQDPAFCKKLLTVWLITAARAAFNEGEFTAQGLLILAGEQGIGKTRFKNMLLPEPSWSCDRTIDPAIKDDVLDAAHYWLVELAEFRETMRYQSIDRLKQYITQSKDAVRPPYARATREYPRTTVFIGTVNGLSFLQDHTGNRRYWPIAVDAIDIDDNFPREQLWGEVMFKAFEKNEPAYLTREEISTLAMQNQNYERVSELEQLLLDELDWTAPVEAWRRINMTDLCYELPGLRANQSASLGRTVTAMKRKDARIGLPSGHHGGRTYTLPPRKADGGPEVCPGDREIAKLLW